MLITSHIWQSFRRKTWQTYQHYRNIRVQMLLIERKRWPPHLEERLIKELIPLMETGSIVDIKHKVEEFNIERRNLQYDSKRTDS